MNISNFLTLIRFLLIPIFIETFYMGSNYILPFSIFILAGITDVLDGFFARKYNLITKWGKLLDPLADKVLQISVLFVLTDKKIIPLWIIIIVIIIEFFLIIGSGIIYKNKIIVQAKWHGKFSTVLFYTSIILIMFVDNHLGMYAISLAVVTALYSALRYTMDYLKVMRKQV